MESIVTECGRLLLFTLMNLTSVDITRILSANAETRNVFLCCAPFYAIPYAKPYPHAIVVNTGAPCRRRAHWCVLYVVSASLVEYFDPLAASPGPQIALYMDKYSSVLRHPKVVRGSATYFSACYAIYFIAMRSARRPMSSIYQTLKAETCPDDCVALWYYSIC